VIFIIPKVDTNTHAALHVDMVVYYVQYLSHKNPYLVGRDETGKPAAVIGCGSFFFNKNFGMIFAEQIVRF